MRSDDIYTYRSATSSKFSEAYIGSYQTSVKKPPSENNTISNKKGSLKFLEIFLFLAMFFFKNKKCWNTEIFISQKYRQKIFRPEDMNLF